MSVDSRNYCSVTHCWRWGHMSRLCRWHQADPDHNTNSASPGPLVCTCLTPAPTGTDQCDRCKRVIANLVHQRRRGQP